MLAARHGHVESLCLLLSCHADPLKTDHKGLTAAHYAAAMGHSRVLRVLAGHSAGAGTRSCVDLPNPQGFTPLHFAAWHQQPRAVRALCEAGASLTSRTHGDMVTSSYAECALTGTQICCGVGSNPLHVAAIAGGLPTMKALLTAYAARVSSAARHQRARPADPRQELDLLGNMPYSIAVQWGHRTLLDVLHPHLPIETYAAQQEAALQAAQDRQSRVPRLQVIAAKAVEEALLMQLDSAQAVIASHKQRAQKPQQHHRAASACRTPAAAAPQFPMRQSNDGFMASAGGGADFPTSAAAMVSAAWADVGPASAPSRSEPPGGPAQSLPNLHATPFGSAAVQQGQGGGSMDVQPMPPVRSLSTDDLVPPSAAAAAATSAAASQPAAPVPACARAAAVPVQQPAPPAAAPASPARHAVKRSSSASGQSLKGKFLSILGIGSSVRSTQEAQLSSALHALRVHRLKHGMSTGLDGQPCPTPAVLTPDASVRQSMDGPTFPASAAAAARMGRLSAGTSPRASYNGGGGLAGMSSPAATLLLQASGSGRGRTHSFSRMSPQPAAGAGVTPNRLSGSWDPGMTHASGSGFAAAGPVLGPLGLPRRPSGLGLMASYLETGAHRTTLEPIGPESGSTEPPSSNMQRTSTQPREPRVTRAPDPNWGQSAPPPAASAGAAGISPLPVLGAGRHVSSACPCAPPSPRVLPLPGCGLVRVSSRGRVSMESNHSVRSGRAGSPLRLASPARSFAGSAVLAFGAGSESFEDTCSVCMDAGDFVAITGCNHQMCVACARELVRIHTGHAAHCPFCRRTIAGFVAACALHA